MDMDEKKLPLRDEGHLGAYIPDEVVDEFNYHGQGD